MLATLSPIIMKPNDDDDNAWPSLADTAASRKLPKTHTNAIASTSLAQSTHASRKPLHSDAPTNPRPSRRKPAQLTIADYVAPPQLASSRKPTTIANQQIKAKKFTTTANNNRQQKQKPTTSTNPLDSTAVRPRGKERETPKRKRPTKLKSAILRDRQSSRRRRRRNNSVTRSPSTTRLMHNAQTTNSRRRSSSVPNRQVTAAAAPNDQWSELMRQLGHSARSWRPYCLHRQSAECDRLAVTVLQQLEFYQTRKWQSDPSKARLHRRFVCGLKEVGSALKASSAGSTSVKLVVVAPDAESSPALRQRTSEIFSLADGQRVPIVFCLGRYKIGRSLKKGAPISVVGVLSDDVVREQVQRLGELSGELREAYCEEKRQLLAATFHLQVIYPQENLTENEREID